MSRFASGGAFLFAMLAAAAAAAWYGEYERYALVLAVGLVVISPLVLRVFQRRFDLFEPITLIAIALLILFVLRPGAHLLYGEWIYRSRDIRPGFTGAMLIALVGTVALYAGYTSRLGPRAAGRLRPLPADWNVARAVGAALAICSVGAVLSVVFALQVGGSQVVQQLLLGRTTGEGAIFRSSSAYLYFGPFLAIPATLLLAETRARYRVPGLALLTAAVGAIVLTVTTARGDRSWLLPLLFPLVVLPFLRRGRRPRFATTLILAAVFIVVASFLQAYRVTETRTDTRSLVENWVQQPSSQLRQFMLGPDTEMFSILALADEQIPDALPRRPGITLTSLVAAPVPGQLWPAKPESADNYIYQALFPAQALITRAGPAPSMFGGYFVDGGLIGVAIYSALLGALARTLFEYYRRYRDVAGVRLFYATTLPFLIILVRGNFTDTLPRASFILPPLLFGLWFASRRRARWA